VRELIWPGFKTFQYTMLSAMKVAYCVRKKETIAVAVNLDGTCQAQSA
jgi:hypothetical protein